MRGRKSLKRGKSRKKGLFRDWKKALIFSLLAFFLGMGAALIYLHPGESTRVRSLEIIKPQSEDEEQQLEKSLEEEEEEGRFLEEYSVKGKICLVLDDVGYGKERVLKFLDMGVPVSIAVLPGGEHSRFLARVARKKGFTVLLHMPMQSEMGVEDRTSKFLLKVGMRETDVVNRLEMALKWAPGASGVSNHMGSRFTRDSGGMKYLATYLKREGLFFLDSKTTPGSVAPFVCRVSGVKLLQRDVFIDNDNNAESIRAQFEELKQKASENGFAVGLLHPGPEVVSLVEELVRESLYEGYRFVTLREVVESG